MHLGCVPFCIIVIIMIGSFLKACERLNVEPDRVLVVGDDLISDIYGGNRNVMRNAWVREVEL